MRFLEYQAKELLKDYGFKVPEGRIFDGNIQDIPLPAVVKAQIPVGGRGKAGGIVFAETEKELQEAVNKLIEGEVRGFPVRKVLIEEKLDIRQEFFASFVIDSSSRQELLILSDLGGVDIEEVAKREPKRVRKRYITPIFGLRDYEIREELVKLGISGKLLFRLTDVVLRLWKVFQELDATILEVNPLVLTGDGNLYIADVHMEIEDEAMPRHPELKRFVSEYEEFIGTRVMTELERKAREIDEIDHRGVAGRFIEFDGNLGLLIGGGGASLTVFDAIRKYGGRPANYCEIGGNPSVKKVAELTKLLLSKPGVEKIAVIMNVVSNTRVDLVARGVIKGILEAGKDPAEVISVFRIPGAWEDEGFKILEKYGVKYLTREYSLDDAARIAVLGDS